MIRNTDDLRTILSLGGYVHLTDNYEIDQAVEIPNHVDVHCHGTIRWVGPPKNPSGHILKFKHRSENSSWTGGILDANGCMTNGLAISTTPETGADSKYIRIRDLTCMNTRIDPDAPEFAGGGKGITCQFRVSHVSLQATMINCDFGMSIEAARNGERWCYDIDADISCINCEKAALFLSGSLPPGYNDVQPFNVEHAKYGQNRIRLYAQNCGYDGHAQIVTDYAVLSDIQATLVGGNPKVWRGSASHCKADISILHGEPILIPDHTSFPGPKASFQSLNNQIKIVPRTAPTL